ncbi:MAG: helix-hairpin-helix domain-containing protein [Lacibacter sp.]
MQLTQKKWVREYFTFSQKERRAVIILAICATLFALLPTMFPFLVKTDLQLVNNPETEKELAQLKQLPETSNQNSNDESTDHLFEPKAGYNYSKNQQQAGTLFYFDPNTVSAAELHQLGLRDKTIQTILNFRSKGGKFRHAEDINKIYGLRTNEYERLLPFVKIQSAEVSNQNINSVSEAGSSAKMTSNKSNTFVIDINNADTTEWKKLNGIGSKLSQRIVYFRSKLGGFVSIEQVAETYGLPDSTFQKIKSQLQFNPISYKKINLNTATIEELKAHPYIKYPIANAIIQYRNEHGRFSSVQDLQKIGAVDEAIFSKISPYLTTD